VARPVSIKNDVILEAARKVFLRHGYEASTMQVAREAGISEGTLFKRFTTKSNLFLTAMEAAPVDASWQEALLRSAGTSDMRVALESAGRRILDHLQAILPRVMMIRAHGIVLQRPECDADGIPHPIQRVRALANYFRAEIRHGRLAMENPEAQAQVFIGALTHYVFQNMVFEYRPVSPTAYVRTIVDMILRAAAPERTGKPDTTICRHLKGSRPRILRVRSGVRSAAS